MSRRPARCTQADIARAIKAVEQTHANMAVEILPDGTIRLQQTGKTQEKSTPFDEEEVIGLC